MPAVRTKKLKPKLLTRSNRDFRRPKESKRIDFDFVVKKWRGAKKVLYKLDVPLAEEEREDPDRKARREAFLKKRKQFYTDYKKVQLAKVLIKEEDALETGGTEIQASGGDN